MPSGGRVDERAVTLVVAGTDCGIFDKKSGGLIDSDETKYRPGNMGKPYALGGGVTVENLTVSRNFLNDRDLSLLPFLKEQVGKGRVTVTEQFLDVDGNAVGAGPKYTGILKSLNPPEHDSESGDAAMIELEISTDGDVAV